MSLLHPTIVHVATRTTFLHVVQCVLDSGGGLVWVIACSKERTCLSVCKEGTVSTGG